MSTDGFVLGLKTSSFIEHVKNRIDLFDFSSLHKRHDLYSIKNQNVISKLKIRTPKNVSVDELICWGSKAFSFKCRGF